MKLGIVGLPNVGKSTLFNALMQAGAEAANYPFSTVNPNVGMVPVPDERLQKLNEMYHAKSVVPAVIEMVDIAGLVKGASRGEGLGNQFLSHIREVDAIVHVVRCFEDENILHVYPDINPMRDIETVNLELIFADLEVIERRLAKTGKSAKSDKSLLRELDILTQIKTALEDGKSAREIVWEDADARRFAEEMSLLTLKPVLYALNVSEDTPPEQVSPHLTQAEAFATAEGSAVFTVCAKLEAEMTALDAEEKAMFLQELGFAQGGLERLITAGYALLGLISFLTAGPKEVRAWTIRRGSKAPQAAGKIHSDLERGFIRAEVVAYDDLMRAGTYTAAKEQGLVRSEGKEYVVKDGDVMLIRFNV